MADSTQQTPGQSNAAAEPVKPNGLGAQVTDTASQAAKNVAGQAASTAQDVGKQAANAASEATKQAANLAQQAAAQASAQAAQAVNAGLQQGVEKLKGFDIKEFLSLKAGQPKVANDEKLWSLVSYIPMVSLLALLIKSESGYVRLHGRQGLLIFVMFFLCIFLYIIPWIGVPLASLIQFLLFALGIIAMYQALIGNWWKIPVVGDLSEQIPMSFFSKVKEAATGLPSEQNSAQLPDQSNDQKPNN